AARPQPELRRPETSRPKSSGARPEKDGRIRYGRGTGWSPRMGQDGNVPSSLLTRKTALPPGAARRLFPSLPGDEPAECIWTRGADGARECDGGIQVSRKGGPGHR